MKSFLSIGIVIVIGLISPIPSSADFLTTLFASNGGGSPGGAVYFDIMVGSRPLRVARFDTNTSSSEPFGWSVFVLPGMTHDGNEPGPGWLLTATGNGMGAGFDNPSPVTLDSRFLLEANTLYGTALVMGAEADHRYTNGNGSNQNYSNDALALAAGSASNVPFIGAIFTPRVWNGTIYYTVVPEPSTMGLLTLAAVGLIAFGTCRRGTGGRISDRVNVLNACATK